MKTSPVTRQSLKRLNQVGISHIFVPLAILVLVGVAGAFTVVAKHSDTANLSAATSRTTSSRRVAHHSKFKLKKQLPPKLGSSIQFAVVEQTTDSNGKVSKSPRGNVYVSVEAAGKNQRCRDGGRNFSRHGNVVFTGKTDADHAHKTNLGKIKVDKCSVGVYTLKVVLSDKYTTVGKSQIKVRLTNRKPVSVKFVVKKVQSQPIPAPAAAAPAAPADTPAVPQDTSTIPDPAPAATPLEPLTADQEMAAVNTSTLLELDNLGAVSNNPNDDLGLPINDRKANFAQHASSYATQNLINLVNNQYGGDSFQLLGISDLKAGQYGAGTITSSPTVNVNSPTSVTVEHAVSIPALNPPMSGFSQASDVNVLWDFNLVLNGNTWYLDSVKVTRQ